MRGGQWQVLLLMEALAQRGHEQELFARPDAPLLGAVRAAGFRATAVRHWLKPPAARFPIDVIHAHDARAHSAAAAWLAPPLSWLAPPARARPALVVSRRVAFPVKRGRLSAWKYARATRFIAVSRYVARELEHAGIPPERIEVVYDGVRLPDLSRKETLRRQFREQLAIPGDAFVAGTLTSLREKPIEPLLEVAESKPRLHLLVCSGDVPSGFQQPEGRKANVRFLPRQPEISPFLFALDAFVYLSESEGLGSAALLAMAHALPVIASDAGGLPEIVRNGQTGMLVENTAVDVGAALERLFTEPKRRQTMGIAGRAFAEQNASDGIMAEQTERVYQSATAV